MHKKYKMSTSIFTTVFLISTVLGCSSNTSNPTAGGKEKRSDISNDAGSKDKMTYSYFVPFASSYQQVMKDYNDNLVFQEMEKRTGVHIKWVNPPAGQETQQYTLMIGSGDYTDIVQEDSFSYPGGPDKAVKDKVYLRLNELIDKYAPNFKKVLDSNPEIRKDIVTDEGNIWGFPMIQTDLEPSWKGPVVRKDWLDELGLPVPQTIDDWYRMLKAFKEKKGAAAPFELDQNGLSWTYSFVGAFNVNGDFFQAGGKVKYSALEQGFKEYLMTMNKWYKEGLIDHDFATSANTNREKYITSGKTGALDAGFYEFEKWEKMSGDPKMKIVGVPYPSLNKGEKPHFRQSNRHVRGYFTAVTTKAKKPEEAVKWLDYFYSPEGQVLANYGIEGQTYKVENGKYVFTDMVSKNKEGVTPSIAMAKYAVHHGPMVRDWTREMYLYSKDANEAETIWTDSATDDQLLPPLTRNSQEGDEFSKIMGDIDTYVKEMTLRFIIGDASFDTYDQFVKKLKSMNIDKAIQLQQAALDRYNARK